GGGEHPARRPRHPHAAARLAQPPGGARAAGPLPLLAHHPRERRPRARRRRRRARRLGGAHGGARARPDGVSPGPRHHRRRARRDALGRAEAARRARARARRRAAGTRPRRRALERRRRDGAHHPRPAARFLPRAHDHPGRAPLDHREGGGPDLRARRGPRGRAGGPREPARARRRVRRPLPPAGARGRAGGDLMPAEIHGEQELGKAYDARLLRRLWTYVRPYRGIVCLALLLSPVYQLLEQVQPYLMKLGIDRYVQRGDASGLRILGFMLWINWALALVSLALLPVMVFAIDYFRRMARKTYRLIRERIGRINGYLQEAISGMAAIALAGREARAFAEFERLNADHRDANHLSNKLEAALFSFVEAGSGSCATSPSASRRASTWRSWGRRARGRRPSSSSSTASTTCSAAASWWTASTYATGTRRRSGAGSRWCSRTCSSSAAPSRR